ncbi:MAG: hypothetical protein JWR54_2068 [Mucilaginibacter sp.]|jgi:hypothetical protein|nr:hypothetical protein [Mucilaginibacter sp.]
MPILARKITLLLLLLGIIACGRRDEKHNGRAPVDSAQANPRKDSSFTSSRAIHIDTGSVVSVDTIPYIDLEPRLKEIAKADYEKYIKTYGTVCPLDSNGFIKGSGLSLESSCDEVCQTFLIERKSGKRIQLYADFDEGL